MPRISSGLLLVVTGVLHCAVGFAIAGPDLLSIAADGFLDAVHGVERKMIFWFEMGGVLFVLLGAFMREFERRGSRYPLWFGAALTLIGVAGVAMIPKSGFWLVIPQGLWLVVQARQGAKR